MKIVADRNIPFLEGVFEPYCEVAYVDGKEIVREDLVDADAIIIRTRTRCDASLLDGTKVKMIATATIGTDHIDFDYCNLTGLKSTMPRAAMPGAWPSMCFRLSTEWRHARPSR